MTITVNYSNENACDMAQTLYPEDLGFHEKSKWTIEGTIHEDYFEWVNEFEATHPVYGNIKGDFEKEVTAESQEALDHFLKNHSYHVWDYGDI